MHHPTKYFTLDFCTITTCCCHDTHYTPRTHTPHTFYYPARRCTTCRTHLELLYSTLRQYPVHKHATTASVDQHPNRAANVDQRTEFSQSPRRYRYPGSAALVQIGILKMLLLREELSLIKQKKKSFHVFLERALGRSTPLSSLLHPGWHRSSPSARLKSFHHSGSFGGKALCIHASK